VSSRWARAILSSDWRKLLETKFRRVGQQPVPPSCGGAEMVNGQTIRTAESRATLNSHNRRDTDDRSNRSKQALFCDLTSATLHALERVKSTATYPAGTTLFGEGQPTQGVFIICRGRVKLPRAMAGSALIPETCSSGISSELLKAHSLSAPRTCNVSLPSATDTSTMCVQLSPISVPSILNSAPPAADAYGRLTFSLQGS
jgi:hypothetical protein